MSVKDIVNNVDPTFIEEYDLERKEKDGRVVNIFTYDGMLDYLYGMRRFSIEPGRATQLINALEEHVIIRHG